MLKRHNLIHYTRSLHKHRVVLYLFLIILSAYYLRTFNINWDNNYYFHPDERAIVMSTIPIELPKSLSQFFNINSPLNPHFFPYGNFPLYLLRISGEIASYINPIYKTYGGIHIIGRPISAVADTFSVLLVFLIASNLFSKRTGLFASLLYALATFPIQLSHFFAVDTILTVFVIATIYFLIKFIQKPSIKRSIFIGLTFGFSLATKLSALIFSIDILLAIILVIIIQIRSKKITSFLYLLPIIFFALLIFTITQPYAIIDFDSFIAQAKLQSQMSKDPFVFPYTLQYVGKIPYFYELKNIFFWGQGPLIASINFLGFFLVLVNLKVKTIKDKFPVFLLLFTTLSYFLIFGKFAVGWMRYMLPIYPLLCVFGGYLLSEISIPIIKEKYIHNHILQRLLLVIFIFILLIYPLSYLSIYSYPNTRIQASDWINKNIPAGKSLAIEHWDDGLPVYGGQKYNILTLPLYESDTTQKWQGINATLQKTDYIIIASNRLYVPLQKLTNCRKLPPGRCYTITANYYKNLFSGKLGFKKVVEFSEYPTIPFLNIIINDQTADESFTVIDHPKIIILKSLHEQ